MHSLRHALPIPAADDSGQDLIEYALIAALVGLGAVAALKHLDHVLISIAAIGNRLSSLV